MVFIPVTEEFDQVREIKDIFPKEEFHRKGLKDIDTFFARREGEEHYKQSEHHLLSSSLSLISLSFFHCLKLLFLCPLLPFHLIQN